ncbi:ABC transporter substrate-binding protein [Spirillospora sp. NPDC127200]
MRHHLTRRWRPLVAAALLVGAAAGCGSDAADQKADTAAAEAAKTRLAANPELTALVAAAKKEGALNLNWGFDGAGTAKALTAAFTAAYGPEIKITLTPSQNVSANVAKLQQEYKAGAPASSDAFLGNSEFTVGVGPKGADALLKVDWERIAPWTKGLAGGDGAVLSLSDLIPGFTYNTGQITEKDLPRSARDVVGLGKPVASTPYAAQFNVLGDKGAMGPDGLRAYLKDFKPAGYLGCGELNRVASGEFAALWISCGRNNGDMLAAKGAPIATEIIKDAAIVSTRYMAIPKNARHPNAAKLWTTWLVTPEAQRVLMKHEFADNRRIAGSRTAEQIADYEARGVKFTKVDYDFAAGRPELYNGRFKGELVKLLTAK